MQRYSPTEELLVIIPRGLFGFGEYQLHGLVGHTFVPVDPQRTSLGVKAVSLWGHVSRRASIARRWCVYRVML